MECKNCGTTLRGNTSFCTNCGEVVQNEQNEQNNRKKDGSGKSLKWVYVLIPVIGIIALFFSLQYYFGADRQLENMKKAFLDQDKEAFAEYFGTSNGENLQEDFFYQAVEEYGWEEIAADLSAAVKNLEKSKGQDPIMVQSDSGPMFSVDKTKKFGVFDHYQIQVMPQPVYVGSSLNDLKVTLHNKTYDLVSAENHHVTDLLPGTYEITSKHESSFGVQEVEQSLIVGFFPDQNYANIILEVMDVQVNGDIREAVVYIDGKTTNQTIDKLGIISNIPKQTSAVAYAKYQSDDGTTFQSEEVKLSDGDIYFKFPEFDKYIDSQRDYKVELEEFFFKHREAFLHAITFVDFSFVEDTFKGGTETYKEYEEFVLDHSNFGDYQYVFLQNELKSFKRLAEHEFEFLTYETFEFTSEADGKYLYERDKRYVVQLLENEYKIVEVENLTTNKEKQ